MNRFLKRCGAAALALAMILSLGVLGASAAGEKSPDYAKYNKGVTVEADAASPTGYTATFVYAEQESYKTKDGKTLGEITKVELYSDCMMLFAYDEVPSGTAINNGSEFMHKPGEFKIGLYPGGGTGATTYTAEMTEFSDGLWGTQVPLTSGAFVYNFRVTDKDGTQLSRLDDPSNPTVTNTATGIRSLSSMVYVPYSAAKMGTGKWIDRSVELPLDDAAKRGKVETVSYTGADNTEHGLAVYLPAGYDAKRAEPYKVLYISHGTSGDVYGDELRWMHEGAAANIMDNLVAQGKAEPFVVVAMNNQEFSKGEGHQGPDWDFSLIEKDQIDCIMPYVEKNYNVSKEAAGRAYAGLSMGGFTTSNMLMYHGDLFSYYGVWSYANVDALKDQAVLTALAGLKGKVHVMNAAGSWDWLYEPVKTYDAELAKLGIDHSFLEVPGGHDWETWQQLFAYAVENFFWKSAPAPAEPEAPAVENPFTDVAASSPFYNAILWAVEQKITNGVTETTFVPANTCTRAQILTFLWRAAGSPEPASAENPFTDVAADAYYLKPALWAVEKGIIDKGETFGPSTLCTRASTVTYLWKHAGSPEAKTEKAFTDVAADADYAAAVAWAVENGITNGVTETTFVPDNTCTRGQIVTFLYRSLAEKDAE